MTILITWSANAVPQNDAAATAEAVMAHAISASNDSVVTTCHSVAIRTFYDSPEIGKQKGIIS
jgi:hypothetical protein